MKDEKSDVGMNVSWLHGAPGKNLKAKVDVTLLQGITQFQKYTDYNFNLPIKKFYSDPQTIFDGEVDSKGNATVQVDIDMQKQAPGKLRANFLTKAFEPGGDFSIDRFSVDYHPFEILTNA